MAGLVTPDGLALDAAIYRPIGHGPWPGAVLCPNFPPTEVGAETAIRTLSELGERIADELGWVVLRLSYRGMPGSEGDFSLGGWFDDVRAATDHLASQPDVRGVWLVGFGTGGALAICAAADDPKVAGVAAMAAPADFDDWAGNPRRLLVHARQLGLIRDKSYPEQMDRFIKPLRQLRAVECAGRVAPRPLLVMHGSDDELVPVFDARVIADSHGTGELRILEGGTHQLRHDPRSIAVLFGWLDRQKHVRLS